VGQLKEIFAFLGYHVAMGAMHQPMEVEKSRCHAAQREGNDVRDRCIGSRGDRIGIYPEPFDFITVNQPIPEFLLGGVQPRRALGQLRECLIKCIGIYGFASEKYLAELGCEQCPSQLFVVWCVSGVTLADEEHDTDTPCPIT
jgi:hypothetical protein